MRTLVVSDLHLGAWTGDPLLSRPFARERLAPHLDDVDELVLNGDVFDFLFSTVEKAFEAADPFFDLLAERMSGRRVVFLAGNHDHHIVVRDLRTAVECRVANGHWGDTGHRNFFQRYMDRKMPDVETSCAYPYHLAGDVLISHGHYLDAHVGGSVANRMMARATWSIAGGRPMDQLQVADYESVIVPLTELLFTVAQLPRGTAAQMSFQEDLERIGKVLGLVARAKHAMRHAVGRNGTATAVPGSPARASSPTAEVPAQLAAYAKVVRNLGWDRVATKHVFSHTHQPLAGVTDPACPGVRFWNTGSWIYEPSLGNREDYVRYLERAWPGTAVLIDTDEPEPRLVECLADQNPLSGLSRDEVQLRRTVMDRFSERAARYAATLR